MEGVRPATESDVPRLIELARAFRAEVSAQKGGRTWLSESGADVVFREILAEPSTRVLVGLIDDVDVGYALVRHDGDVARLDELYVEPEARGVGVGSILLEAAAAWAKDQGCTGLDAQALPGARETKNFFEAHGLVTRLLTVHRELS
jgi:GNAT superfamily N-acetyltransferase